MKKYLLVLFVVIAFFSVIHMTKNRDVPLPNQPTVSNKKEEPLNSEPSYIEKLMKKNALDMVDDYYAVYRIGKEGVAWLKISPTTEINEPRDIMTLVSYYIFYKKALDQGLKANPAEVEKIMKELNSGENKKYHDKAQKKSIWTKEQYWKAIREETERTILSDAYLKRTIGDPVEIGGLEYKKAVNKLVEKTFVSNEEDIRVNLTMLNEVIR